MLMISKWYYYQLWNIFKKNEILKKKQKLMTLSDSVQVMEYYVYMYNLWIPHMVHTEVDTNSSVTS